MARFRQPMIIKIISDDRKLLKELYKDKKYVAYMLKLNRKMYNEVGISTLEEIYLARFK